jgi:hypothetical protein
LKLSSEVMIIFPSCRPPPAQIAGHELRNRCQRNAGGRDAAGAAVSRLIWRFQDLCQFSNEWSAIIQRMTLPSGSCWQTGALFARRPGAD